MSGVMQVPMLPPKTKAAAMSNEIHPLLHMMSAMANVALEACTIMVSTMPTSANISIDQ